MNVMQLLKTTLFISFSLFTLTGCQNQQDPKVLIESHKVGGDRDVYGCIGSAGFQWCAKEIKCVRAWELAKDKNFENSQESFKQYCS
jgi:uncharacterized lipoprotein NlpE involved in copper resistance